MKKTAAALLFLALACAAAADSLRFDQMPPGDLPAPAWRVAGRGSPRWQVEADASAPSGPNILKQTGQADFSLCLKTRVFLQNGFVEVKLQPFSGTEDQAGGVIFRAEDSENYYVCRASALEGNVALFKMVDGERRALDAPGKPGDYGARAPDPAKRWSTLRVEFAGPRFVVFLDGRRLFEAKDETFRDPGMVGLWTRADSVTGFDDFEFGSGAAPAPPPVRK